MMQLGAVGQERRAFKLGERLILLYNELGDGPDRKVRTYYGMFQMAVLQRGTLKLAGECAARALEHMERLCGGSKREPLELAQLRAYASNPEKHAKYLAHEGTGQAWLYE